MLKGHCIHGVVTGKPICLGGALEEMKPRDGASCTTKNILNKMGIPVQGTTVAIQGMGNVGSITAKLLHREGMKIIAVSDVSGGICNPEGLNVPAILDYLSLNRKNLLKDYNEEGMSRITNEELLEMDARVLVPLKIRLTLPMHIKSVRKSSWRLQTARWPQTLTGYSRKEALLLCLISWPMQAA